MRILDFERKYREEYRKKMFVLPISFKQPLGSTAREVSLLRRQIQLLYSLIITYNTPKHTLPLPYYRQLD